VEENTATFLILATVILARLDFLPRRLPSALEEEGFQIGQKVIPTASLRLQNLGQGYAITQPIGATKVVITPPSQLSGVAVIIYTLALS
jgi:hypothetical protein